MNVRLSVALVIAILAVTSAAESEDIESLIPLLKQSDGAQARSLVQHWERLTGPRAWGEGEMASYGGIDEAPDEWRVRLVGEKPRSIAWSKLTPEDLEHLRSILLVQKAIRLEVERLRTEDPFFVEPPSNSLDGSGKAPIAEDRKAPPRVTTTTRDVPLAVRADRSHPEVQGLVTRLQQLGELTTSGLDRLVQQSTASQVVAARADYLWNQTCAWQDPATGRAFPATISKVDHQTLTLTTKDGSQVDVPLAKLNAEERDALMKIVDAWGELAALSSGGAPRSSGESAKASTADNFRARLQEHRRQEQIEKVRRIAQALGVIDIQTVGESIRQSGLPADEIQHWLSTVSRTASEWRDKRERTFTAARVLRISTDSVTLQQLEGERHFEIPLEEFGYWSVLALKDIANNCQSFYAHVEKLREEERERQRQLASRRAFEQLRNSPEYRRLEKASEAAKAEAALVFAANRRNAAYGRAMLYTGMAAQSWRRQELGSKEFNEMLDKLDVSAAQCIAEIVERCGDILYVDEKNARVITLRDLWKDVLKRKYGL